MPLWQIDIHPAAAATDRLSTATTDEIRQLGLATDPVLSVTRGFLLQTDASAEQIDRIAHQLLADPVVEHVAVGQVGSDAAELTEPPESLIERMAEAGDESDPRLMHVLPKPGVMDPVAASTASAIAELGLDVTAVRTFRKIWLAGVDDAAVAKIQTRVLFNDAIERLVPGPLSADALAPAAAAPFELKRIAIRGLGDEQLDDLSRDGQLYLTTIEMRTIAAAFEKMGRDPIDIELESIAQTWSEHCSHKTLAGRISYTGPNGEKRQFENMLKETIFAATQTIRRNLGDDDWCVSVFKDNAGVVTFDDKDHVCFKVETHNHPSALEPYGGANTGIGGVIRDPMGTGLGAKPFCNTDVFCFAPPDVSLDELPPGVLHPRRVIQGVVAGVRDYGNRMGIPTVNGAVYFDRRYLGNPLVYCGNAGLIPVGKEEGTVGQNDYIVAIGGRTGRDGIHGATFSSAELTSESETLSGGAVQIGNAITEKMVLDVLLQARDRGLYNAVTDCGAGGFSSAVGEMGEHIGAEVWLDKAPLKYQGLTYTEVWISEAQERMVLSVPPESWEELKTLCDSENVEAAIIGRFAPTGRLVLMYHDQTVGDVPMSLLHDGRPPIVRDAVYQLPPITELNIADASADQNRETLLKILASLNVASKHWVIRQYDHEVQGGSIVKPLVGPACDGPSDAAVIRPRADTHRGVVISCGMNPHYGDLDTAAMAVSAIDEAVRNAVCVGADPGRIAILDNFCWGYTDRPETLGSLVRAAIACQDLAVALGTPFISGKDSLNNEFSYVDDSGDKQTIAIPPSLLISAMGQIDDVATAVTMDLKEAGNELWLVGQTADDFGGSHYNLVHDQIGGHVPTVDAEVARRTFAAMHRAITTGLVRSAHDCSEGGLAVAATEMAIAGRLGLTIQLGSMDAAGLNATQKMFAESNTRFLVELSPENAAAFRQIFDSDNLTASRLGCVSGESEVRFEQAERLVASVQVDEALTAWRSPLDW